VTTNGIDIRAAATWVGRFDRQQRHYGPPVEELAVLITAIVSCVVGGARGRVLDVGCGPGTLARSVQRALPEVRVMGVDRDPLLMALARALGGADFVDVDLREKTWPHRVGLRPASVDVAVATASLHMLGKAELTALLGQLGRVIRPGGVIVVSDRLPDLASPLAPIRAALGDALTAAAVSPDDETWMAWWDAAAAEPLFRGLLLERSRRGVAPDPPGRTRRTYEEQLARAGFQAVEPIWMRGDDVLLCGIR
jgi:SAM-dependent methyltransferase